VSVRINAASITTENAARDKDLRSANFLDTEKYPEITFVSHRVEDVEVAVEFQVSSKCVLYNNNEDISSILHVDPLLDHGSTKGGQVVKEVTVLPKDRPEFLSRKLPKCSIIRPTETHGVAMGAVKFLTAMGLFIGQSEDFFELLRDLAEEADEARRECH
jgi:YceI-like domain